jgi:AcrR family transcriptional regulator
MPATVKTMPKATRPRPVYRKLQPRWCGLTRDEVLADQRERLYRAMIEIAATRGYHATTIKAICTLAGVSRQTFYDLFVDEKRRKEACFLGAYDYVVEHAVERIRDAYLGEDDPELRLCRAFEQFAQEAAMQPQAARLALLETLGAGRAAFDRVQRGRAMFEHLITASLSDPSDPNTLSPAIAKGIVGGVERVTRVHLLEGRIDQLPATAGELSAWVSSYRSTRRPAPGRARPATVRPQVRLRGSDDGIRIARATAALASTGGYGRLTPARICGLAEVSEEAFGHCYEGPDAIEACFLAAFDLLGAEALVCAARASREAGGWPEAVRDGIAALLGHIAEHPYLARVAFVEIFVVGPSAIERRSRLLRKFAEVFTKRIPREQRPSELVAEAITGAIWAIVHDYVVCEKLSSLDELVDDATYLALAPVIGAEDAADVILGDRGIPSAGRAERQRDGLAARDPLVA